MWSGETRSPTDGSRPWSFYASNLWLHWNSAGGVNSQFTVLSTLLAFLPVEGLAGVGTTMASSTAALPTTWADVSIEYQGNALTDTAAFDHSRKLLITYVGVLSQHGAAIGSEAIAAMEAPALNRPTPAADINNNYARACALTRISFPAGVHKSITTLLLQQQKV